MRSSTFMRFSLHEWFQRILKLPSPDLLHAIGYVVTLSCLANLFLIAGIASLYHSKRAASIALGLGSGAITFALPFVADLNLFVAPCFLAWHGSMILLVFVGIVALVVPDKDGRRPDETPSHTTLVIAYNRPALHP